MSRGLLRTLALSHPLAFLLALGLVAPWRARAQDHPDLPPDIAEILREAEAFEQPPPSDPAPPSDPTQTGPLPAPPVGAWLTYRYDERLVGGTGEYEGYAETTTATARYEILGVERGQVGMRGRYTWTYRSPERTETESEDRTVTFALEDRRYTSPQTDSSDYDDRSAGQLATWIWIPPGVAVGDRVPILDHDFEVVSTSATVRTRGGAERPAIELLGRYQGFRSDEYGNLATRTVDRYFFDRETGMFLREEVEERDFGALGGADASFVLETDIDVEDASYAPAIPGYVPPAPPTVAIPAYHRGDDDPVPAEERSWLSSPAVVVAAPFAVLAFFLLFLRRTRSAEPTMADGTPFAVERVTDPKTLELPMVISPRYQPFLAHFAEVAHRSDSPVAVARAQDGRVVGLGLGDREANVGSIFAPDSDVCEQLRRSLGCSEFFSEIRHPALASVKRAQGVDSPAQAYNVYETYEVLVLREAPEDLGYDREVVRRMTAEDRGAVLELMKLCYGVPSERWLDAALAAGDLAWVARDGDRVIGVAMASLCGDAAHLHALTVHPESRGRGIGTALMRARLRALFDLGATSIVSECATWNLAAREVAGRHGFQKVGDMYVESSDTAREERKFVRR